jgi:hypothetical protein
MFLSSSRVLTSVTATMDGEKYNQAMSELPKAILATVNDGKKRTLLATDVEPVEDEWRVLRSHPRGGAFIRKLNDDLALEVHLVYPFN